MSGRRHGTRARRAAACAFVLLALAGLATRGWCQGTPGVVRGVVRSASGDGVPFALVTLAPGPGQRFTDQSGRFAFPGVAPGSYRLVARQVGYRRFDAAIVVSDSGLELTVRLEPVVVEVSEITVTAPRRCTAPGPPDPALNPALAAVFEELRENARRYWLFADSYPAVYRMERTMGTVAETGEVVPTSSDTLDLRTDARWRYAPGRLVAAVPPSPQRRAEMQANLPTLPDLADSAFHRTHCFYLAGMDTVDGRRYVRLDFLADQRMRATDVDGSAWMDSTSYLVRHIAIRLTHPDHVDFRLEDLRARARFREVVPAVLLVDSISAVRTVLYAGASGPQRLSEEQRLLSVHFLRPIATRP